MRRLVPALGVLAVLLSVWAGRVAAREELVVRAGRVHPVASPPIDDGVVVIRDGRIAAVGAADTTPWPRDAELLEAAVVTPGFIDAHSSVGLSGLRNVAPVLDQDETSAPDQADLRALDAFDPRSPMLRHLLEHGVTLVQAGPGPAVPIAGQAGIFRTSGESADAMAVRFPSALVFNLGEEPKETFGSKGGFPVTRMGTAALVRRRLAEARRAGRRTSWIGPAPPHDAGLEVLAQVVSGELPALFVADRADDIATALRISREFGLRAQVAGGAEAYRMADTLRDAGLGLLLGPVMVRPTTPALEYASFENAARLAEAGVPFALRSGFEGYVPRNRLVLFEAAVAVANGLERADALRALTLDAARLLDVAEDHGSIEAGKRADLVLFDADPFEYTSHVGAVLVGGRVVHRRQP
ncbi:MAG: amidohydrolase family protein [Myxococcota bacterium]